MREIIVIRGGGDIASGVAHRLKKCGYNIFILEAPQPTVIRRKVAYATAVFEGEITIENISAKLARDLSHAYEISAQGEIPVLVDPEGLCIEEIKPHALIDCILAKVNTGITKDMAPIVVGVGPGFVAGEDVHATVETNRGHDLGKTIYEGGAAPDTGEPGNVEGYSYHRLIRASDDGIVKNVKDIGDFVEPGEVICTVNGQPVKSSMNGIIRGLIMEGSKVYKGMKIGDIDPRGEEVYCYTISEKARAIAGGVLEAMLALDFELKSK